MYKSLNYVNLGHFLYLEDPFCTCAQLTGHALQKGVVTPETSSFKIEDLKSGLTSPLTKKTFHFIQSM